MDIGTIGFWAISAVLAATAIFTIESKKLVHSVLFLFIFLITVAALFLYLNAVFLGIAELIIYNGGIVLLLAIGITLMPEGSINGMDKKYLVIIPVAVLAVLSFLLLRANPGPISTSQSYSSLGSYFFTNYGVVLIFLAVTSIASLLTTVYLINKDDLP